MDEVDGAPDDAIGLLMDDHRMVEQLFEDLANASPGEKASIGQRLVQELSIHAAVEEQIVYPMARSVTGADSLVDQAIDEHEELKRVLADLDGLGPDDEAFASSFAAAERLVATHVAEEESALLPRLRAQLGHDELRRLARSIVAAKGRLQPGGRPDQTDEVRQREIRAEQESAVAQASPDRQGRTRAPGER